MTTTSEQIDLWRGSPSEQQRLEFKEAKTQFDARKLQEYCVAIGNEGGGTLLLGIADRPPRPVVGTQAARDPVGLATKLFESLGFRVDIEEVMHPDGRVVVFHIPSRPRGTAYHVDGKYLMRAGESLVPMSEDQLRRIFAEGGALLLAKQLSDFPDLARKAPRVVVYSGSSKVETRLDQVGTKGFAVGFGGLIRFIMTQLPQNEVVENAIRRQVKLVPEIAVRELVANALIHQDLSISGTSMMVEIYSDRVEISNPGDPVVPVERFIDGYESRNERMADLMRRLGICEEKSSGVDKVVSAAEAFQLPAPDFRVGHRRTSVSIYGPRTFQDMDGPDRVTGLLPALLPTACYEPENVESEPARALQTGRGQSRNGIKDYQGNNRPKAHQAG